MRAVAIFLVALTVPSVAFGQEAPAAGGADDAQELAKQLSNPVASLISVPFQENLDWGGGFEEDGFKSTLNVQPVVPISISGNANLIVRTIVPIIYQSDITGEAESEFGLGDTVQSFFYSPSKPAAGGIIWGAGPVFLYPTATSGATGGEKWGVGPTIVVLKQIGHASIGVLANHIWSVAGDEDRSDVSATFLQPFYSYTTPKATTYTINTETTYDWKAEKWSVPINLTVTQLVKLGKQPISFGVGGRYYVSSPHGGARAGVRLTTTFLFPKH